MVMPVAWIAAPERGWAIAEGLRKPGGRHDGIKGIIVVIDYGSLRY